MVVTSTLVYIIIHPPLSNQREVVAFLLHLCIWVKWLTGQNGGKSKLEKLVVSFNFAENNLPTVRLSVRGLAVFSKGNMSENASKLKERPTVETSTAHNDTHTHTHIYIYIYIYIYMNFI